MKRPAFGSAAKSVTGEVVDGFAAYGRVTAIWSAVVVTILAAIGVGVGVWLINKSGGQLTSFATATAPSTCAQERVSTGRTSRLERKCTTEVAYAAAGQEHRTSVDTSAKSYASGDKLSVYYDAGSPGDPTATRIPGLAVGSSSAARSCSPSWSGCGSSSRASPKWPRRRPARTTPLEPWASNGGKHTTSHKKTVSGDAVTFSTRGSWGGTQARARSRACGRRRPTRAWTRAPRARRAWSHARALGQW